MSIKTLYLKDYFSKLEENECNAYVEAHIAEPLKEMGLENIVHPCMIICPGGGYGMISGREGTPIALHFASEGYNVFVLHYSVKPHRFPQQLREVAGVVELIHMHKDEWKCDVSNIALMGFSAGGHLAAQYANRFDCPEIREIFPNSKPVQKSVLCYPVITGDERYMQTGTMRNLLGRMPENPEDSGCSCELLVSEKTPPTFLWHTAEDEIVAVENSLCYANALSRHKIPFELHIYPYGSHGMATADETTCLELNDKTRHCHQWIDDCKKWLKLTPES